MGVRIQPACAVSKHEHATCVPGVSCARAWRGGEKHLRLERLRHRFGDVHVLRLLRREMGGALPQRRRRRVLRARHLRRAERSQQRGEGACNGVSCRMQGREQRRAAVAQSEQRGEGACTSIRRVQWREQGACCGVHPSRGLVSRWFPHSALSALGNARARARACGRLTSSAAAASIRAATSCAPRLAASFESRAAAARLSSAVSRARSAWRSASASASDASSSARSWARSMTPRAASAAAARPATPTAADVCARTITNAARVARSNTLRGAIRRSRCGHARVPCGGWAGGWVDGMAMGGAALPGGQKHLRRLPRVALGQLGRDRRHLAAPPRRVRLPLRLRPSRHARPVCMQHNRSPAELQQPRACLWFRWRGEGAAGTTSEQPRVGRRQSRRI